MDTDSDSGDSGDPTVLEGEPGAEQPTDDPFTFFPDGVTTLEGDLPDESNPYAPAESGGEDEKKGEDADTPQPTDSDDEPEGEAGADDEPTEEDLDDVTASEGWLEDVTAKTAIDAEDPDEFVETVNRMRRDLTATEQLRQIFEQAPELAQIVEPLVEKGEPDVLDLYAALDGLEGVKVQIPDAAEDPDANSDLRLRLKEKRKERQRQREQLQEQRRKEQQIVQEFEQAFESFKSRKGLSDEEAERFKEKFARTFYGDRETGELPRMDVFDRAYEILEGGEEEDVPLEETEAYQKGYNAAIEQMKSGGQSDGLPKMITGGSAGENEGGSDRPSGGEEVASFLGPTEADQKNIHDQF